MRCEFLGSPIVWDYLRSHWLDLVDRFSLNDRYLGRMPKFIGADFSTEFRLQQMKDFFAKYPEAGAGNQLTSFTRMRNSSQIRHL